MAEICKVSAVGPQLAYSQANRLEDLCLASLSLASLKCIDDYRAYLAAAGLFNQQSNRLSKGRLDTWLTSQAEPNNILIVTQNFCSSSKEMHPLDPSG